MYSDRSSVKFGYMTDRIMTLRNLSVNQWSNKPDTDVAKSCYL